MFDFMLLISLSSDLCQATAFIFPLLFGIGFMTLDLHDIEVQKEYEALQPQYIYQLCLLTTLHASTNWLRSNLLSRELETNQRNLKVPLSLLPSLGPLGER